MKLTVELNIHARNGQKWRGMSRVNLPDGQMPTEILHSGGRWRLIGFTEFGYPRYMLNFVFNENRIFEYVREVTEPK